MSESQYLLAIHIAERDQSEPIAPGELAEAVSRSPSATSEMLRRLEDRGLVAHEPYDGATLTPEGREAAADLYETYVTLSRFFDEVLELDDYEEEAFRLAGAISPSVTDRLAATLLDDADATAGDEAIRRRVRSDSS